jgi:16S rRNA (adenine(1408)-N(1))-methyltransferase
MVARHDRVAIDLGAGDGRAVLARAATEPRTLVIAIDADAASMIESSRRAARTPRRGGLLNALFVVAAAETPPPELADLAARIDVILPWGSLLDGILGREPAVLQGIVSLLKPGGRVQAVVSVAPRDRVDGGAWTDLDPDAIATRWTAAGLQIRSILPTTPAAAAALPSTWARRLRLGTDVDDRRTWTIDAVRVGTPVPAPSRVARLEPPTG